MNYRTIAALSGLIAVVAGALGVHALKNRIAPEMLQAFETGARYQMFHALALLAVGAAADSGARAAVWSGRLFVAGTVLFSGSLYVMALSGARIWGAVTPLGGLCLMGGWLALAVSFARTRPH
jgi:uncharacterized membrane protein YgdD (TMEM256/DUF423 family)